MDEVIYHLLEGHFPYVEGDTKVVEELPDLSIYKFIGTKFNVNYRLDVYAKKRIVARKQVLAV